MSDNKDMLLAEVIRRSRSQFAIGEYLFAQQLALVQDSAKFATAVCSRRSGKTIACAADLIDTAVKYPRTTSMYLTTTRLNAKRIIWPELKEINRLFVLGGHPNEVELTLRFPNDSLIILFGGKDAKEIEKPRGLALKLAYIDEAQAFGPHIEDLVNDVLAKALYDHDGRLRLIGTPGPIPSGYFHVAATSKLWSHHAWTMFENPHLQRKSGKAPYQLMQEDCAQRGVTPEHPSMQRECYGRWVVDPSSLVIRYDQASNDYVSLPDARDWKYVIGVDVGFDDSDAIAVIGWNERQNASYIVEEVVRAKQSISDLAEALSSLVARYNPIRVVLDTGGLGKKIAEELRKRFQLPILAAEKARKYEYLELLNDALRTGRLFARADSKFASDSYLLEWDRGKSTPDRLVVSDRYHSDIIDAVLYAFRESLHWLHVPEVTKPAQGSPAWYQAEEARMEAAMQAALRPTDELEGFTPLDPLDPLS